MEATARTIRRWALPVFLATILIPLYWWRDFYSRGDYEVVAGYFQYAAFLTMALLLAASLRFVSLRSAPLVPLAFLGWCALSSLWSIDLLESASSVFGFAVFLFALIGFLDSGDQARGFRYSAWVIVGGLAFLAFFLGIGSRQIGGITANATSHFAFTTLVLLCMRGPVKWWWWVFILGVMVFAQSRTLIIATTVFIPFRYVVLPVTELMIRKARSQGSALIPYAVAALALGVLSLGGELLFGLLREFSIAIGVSDKGRLDTTFTGRTFYWNRGIELFERSPLLGYGYSTRGNLLAGGEAVTAHSGLINLVLDVGLVGGVLFALWYFTSLWRAISGQAGLHPKVSMTCAAALFAMVPVLLAEPNYLGLYDPTSLAFFVSLLLPLTRRRIPQAGARGSLARRKPPPARGWRGRQLNPQHLLQRSANFPGRG